MSEISAENIFHIRKGIISRMGLTQEADDLWFKQLLPTIELREFMKKNKNTILGCLYQSDANFVYEVRDEMIEKLESMIGERD